MIKILIVKIVIQLIIQLLIQSKVPKKSMLSSCAIEIINNCLKSVEEHETKEEINEMVHDELELFKVIIMV